MLLGIGAHGNRFQGKKHVLLSLEVPLQLTQMDHCLGKVTEHESMKERSTPGVVEEGIRLAEKME